MTMIEDVAVFEQAAKKSWQSFSTMRRFVDEATRLENTSWRLWFMQGRSRHDSGDEVDVDHVNLVTEELRLLCVYCDLHSASLSCHGCCHDAYCISCFKLIHKKGNLATHTAIKIHGVRSSGQFFVVSLLVYYYAETKVVESLTNCPFYSFCCVMWRAAAHGKAWRRWW